MANRVVLTLDQFEYSALLKLAIEELRNPSDQARHILRNALEMQGLLPNEKEDTLSLKIDQKVNDE